MSTFTGERSAGNTQPLCCVHRPAALDRSGDAMGSELEETSTPARTASPCSVCSSSCSRLEASGGGARDAYPARSEHDARYRPCTPSSSSGPLTFVQLGGASIPFLPLSVNRPQSALAYSLRWGPPALHRKAGGWMHDSAGDGMCIWRLSVSMARARAR